MRLLTLADHGVLPKPEDAFRTLDSPPAAAVVQTEPVDEIGRRLNFTTHPLLGSQFVSRVRDRLSGVQPPWTPEQITQAFRAAENGDMAMQAALFEFMEERDGALSGFLQTRRLAPCGLKWTCEPADDSPEAEKVAQFVRSEIKAIPNFPVGFRHLTDATGKAMSAVWVDWQEGGRTPQSKYRIDGLYHISPKRYRFHWQQEKFLILPDDKTDGNAALPTALGSNVGVEPLPYKVIVHLTRLRSGHPARAGVLRICALYWMLRNLALKDAAVYCDVFGMPARIAKYPKGTSEEDKAALAEAMELYGTDGIAIISNAVEIVLQEGNGAAGAIPYFELHKECERQMELAVLGQEQTNTSNKNGSRAQAEAGGALVRQDLLEADCIDLETTLTWQLCYPIVMYSRFGKDVADRLCPKFKLLCEPVGDYESMIAVDVPLHTVLKLPTTYGHLAKRYGKELPDGVDPSEIIRFDTPSVGDPGAGGGLQPAGKRDESGKRRRGKGFARDLTELITFSAVSRGIRAQRDIDDLADRASEEAAELMNAFRPVIRAIARKATDLEDLERRLRNAFDDLDAEDLEQIVRRTMFVAQLHGRETAHREVE
jgi:phage gp29-like protein